MRLRIWKSFLCICTSSVLALNTIAYGQPITITPLDESKVASFQPGSSNFTEAERSQGPGSSKNTVPGSKVSQTPSGDGMYQKDQGSTVSRYTNTA